MALWYLSVFVLFKIILNEHVYKVKSKKQIERQREKERERDGVRVGADWACSSVVWGSYLVLKYALMVAGDPFITSRKQKGVSLLI